MGGVQEEEEKDEVREEEEQEEEEGKRERKEEEQGNNSAWVAQPPCSCHHIPAPSPPQQNSASIQPAAEEARVVERSEGWKETSPISPAAPLTAQEEVATANFPASPPSSPSPPPVSTPSQSDHSPPGIPSPPSFHGLRRSCGRRGKIVPPHRNSNPRKQKCRHPNVTLSFHHLSL